MCEYSTVLKIGTTRVVLDLIQHQVSPDLKIENPVAAIKALSKDPYLKTVVTCQPHGTISGLDIQRLYLERAQKTFQGLDKETDWILKEWADVLELLTHNKVALIGSIDWVTKQWLLETFIQEERLEWTDPWLASLDLEYHNINPDRGLFLGLEAEGKTRRMCHDRMIEDAIHNGPRDTRGGIRELCVTRFRSKIQSVQWERIQFKGRLTSIDFDMDNLFDPDDIRTMWQTIEQAPDP